MHYLSVNMIRKLSFNILRLSGQRSETDPKNVPEIHSHARVFDIDLLEVNKLRSGPILKTTKRNGEKSCSRIGFSFCLRKKNK